MISNVRTTVDRRLLTRRCVSCGFDGSSINRISATSVPARCPRCGCDLRRRPPRSYAEMEGLLGSPALSQPRMEIVEEHEHQSRGERLLHRWLAFLFIALLGMLAIAYLASAVMAV
jgi:hypothetical protein